MNFIRSILSLLLLVFLCEGTFAQGIPSITKFEVKFDTLEKKQSCSIDSCNAEVFLFFYVSDTVNIKSVHVQMGRTDGGKEFFSYDVLWNGRDLPNHVTLEKGNTTFWIYAGTCKEIQDYYIQAWLVDFLGNTSEVKKIADSWKHVSERE